MFYKIGQKSHQTFGILLKEICRKKLPKIAQSGHTGLSGVYTVYVYLCILFMRYTFDRNPRLRGPEVFLGWDRASQDRWNEIKNKISFTNARFYEFLWKKICLQELVFCYVCVCLPDRRDQCYKLVYSNFSRYSCTLCQQFFASYKRFFLLTYLALIGPLSIRNSSAQNCGNLKSIWLRQRKFYGIDSSRQQASNTGARPTMFSNNAFRVGSIRCRPLHCKYHFYKRRWASSNRHHEVTCLDIFELLQRCQKLAKMMMSGGRTKRF